ncbi:MAG: OmpA family protein, partial [Comamonas sp.]|nr:OmpA family protein [Comamonas sp.]
KALEKVISGMQSGQNVKISGFHDNLGDAEFIPELVKQRTIAVKNTLMQLGIPEVQIQLSEPEITAATSSNAQARRVEVTLID